jgi:hypothetical protein
VSSAAAMTSFQSMTVLLPQLARNDARHVEQLFDEPGLTRAVENGATARSFFALSRRPAAGCPTSRKSR